uniref:FAM86 N-terminal domain-containing protein n=1 Tax=Ditylenchus dipsaci TaxID=166011 RepID=A0A915EDY1_9BILA
MAGAPVSNEVFDQFPECLRLIENLDLLFSSEIRSTYPGRKSYERTLLKSVIAKLELCKLEASDSLYSRLCEAMVSAEGEDQFFHRVFLDVENDQCFVIRENCQQISNGTTGLATWHASICMAEFLRLGLSQVKNKQLNVLELGSGCGLAGICAGRYISRLSNLVLTDGNSEVLARLKQNVSLNYENNETDSAVKVNQIFVEMLDFTSYDLSNLPAVLASDVVYDLDIIPPLCSLLYDLLCLSSGAIAFISCTIRNPDTLAAFVTSIGRRGLSIRREYLYAPGSNAFVVSSGDGKKINQHRHEFEPTFPVCSLPAWPTVIYEIVK